MEQIGIRKEVLNMENKFDYKTFMLEIGDSDLFGLEYMEKTLIKELKEKYDLVNYTIEEYIVSLFYAVKELNNCNFVYEMTNVETMFEADIYFNAKGKLIEEVKKYLGIEGE